MEAPITIDFETEAIVENPLVKAPAPVGVAIWVPDQDPVYLAFAHPQDNNCSWDQAHQYLMKLRDSGRPLLFHNAPFDLSVWEQYFCNAVFSPHNGSWSRFHDTQYLLFLADPYASTYSLKPSSERWLDLPPEEQNDLYDWIVANVVGATRKTAGAYISRAPVELVAPYAIGDVVRTRKLFDLLHPRIQELGMLAAYDRERRLMPITVGGTRDGIRIDRDTLEHHESVYSRALVIADSRINVLVGNTEGSPVGGDVFADGLDRVGAAGDWIITKTGKRSVAKGNLKIKDPEIKVLYEYRSALETCLTTFMRPWLEFADNDGRLHPNWNQVKSSRDSGDPFGTRTGRLSSDHPNFQNVPTVFEDKMGNPLSVPEGLVPLPVMRRYCLPEEGHVWIKRDFSSQEIRILAHFEDGSLKIAYIQNASMDPHEMARQLIFQMQGLMYDRKPIKITGFSIIYGTGANGLSLQLGNSYQEAYAIKEAYLSAMPGVRELMADVQRRGRSNLPVRTWGGRLYYSEPPKVIDGRLRDFHYKLLNYLIQGSAADQTKDAICHWADNRVWSDTFLATVHDEINICAPISDAGAAMLRLKYSMNLDRFDVPFQSDGFIGPNWADLEGVNY